MFTGRDARTPLPSFTRTSKATSRMKFDRNKNVEADLTFWSSFLGRGGETINIGQRHVEDLLIEAAFLTEEVPEIGLIRDDPKHHDPLSARTGTAVSRHPNRLRTPPRLRQGRHRHTGNPTP